MDDPGGTLIVGIGGTTRPTSSTERCLRQALELAEGMGARTRRFGHADLMLPMYDPRDGERTTAARRLVGAIKEADGLIVASPGYHGGISGLIKNALDYVEDLRDAEPPYLHGRAVGTIVCAYGWQATVTTLGAMRDVIHALRGWPTPLGLTVNSAETSFDKRGRLEDGRLEANLGVMVSQVIEFAQASRLRPVDA